MSNPIMEGFGKGSDLSYIHGRGFVVAGKAINKRVQAYEVASEGRNVALGLKSAAVAGVLTGGVGLVGGALALKKKRLAVITWVSGEESLVEVRSTPLHKALIAESFKTRVR